MSSTHSPTQERHSLLRLLIEVPAIVVTFVMMLHITANALLRSFANSPLPNTLEIVQYWYLPFVAFIGFMAAQQRGQHIAADLVFQLLPHPVRRFVLAGGCFLAAALSLGFAWYGLGEALHAMDVRMTAGVSNVVSWPAYFLVPIAFASLTLQFSVAAVRAVLRPEQGEEGDAQGTESTQATHETEKP